MKVTPKKTMGLDVVKITGDHLLKNGQWLLILDDRVIGQLDDAALHERFYVNQLTLTSNGVERVPVNEIIVGFHEARKSAQKKKTEPATKRKTAVTKHTFFFDNLKVGAQRARVAAAILALTKEANVSTSMANVRGQVHPHDKARSLTCVKELVNDKLAELSKHEVSDEYVVSLTPLGVEIVNRVGREAQKFAVRDAKSGSVAVPA